MLKQSFYQTFLVNLVVFIILLSFIWFFQEGVESAHQDELSLFWAYKMSWTEKLKFSQPKSKLEGKTIYSWNKNENNFELIQLGEEIQDDFKEYRWSKTESGDLNQDSKLENYFLQDGKLTVTQDNEILWQSEDEWWVDDFFLADSTGDGLVEINLSVWKSGNFGASKPFWVEEDDPSVKNHFFVFGFKNGLVKPVWQSSNLAQPNCEFVLADVDDDGKQELVVLEGEYRDDWVCQGKYLAVWQWEEWGFYNQWRSGEENFKNLRIFDKGEKIYITVGEFD